MKSTLGIRMKSPPHPGEFVKHEIISAFSLSITEAAKVLGATKRAASAHDTQPRAGSRHLRHRLLTPRKAPA